MFKQLLTISLHREITSAERQKLHQTFCSLEPSETLMSSKWLSGIAQFILVQQYEPVMDLRWLTWVVEYDRMHY